MDKTMELGQLNEWSYQRYAQFYKCVEGKDADFVRKLKEIYRLIVEDKVTD